MLDLNWLMFASGFGVGVLVATICLVIAAIRDDYREAEKWKKKRH